MRDAPFSQRLKQLRGSQTMASFARQLGIPAPMYHRYEHGQIPKQHNLRVIAEKCETTIEWLLTGKPPPGMRPNDETAPPLSATTEKGDVLNHTEIGILKRQPERIAALEVRVAALEQAIVRLTGKEKAEVE